MSGHPTPAARAAPRRRYLMAVVGSIVLHVLAAALFVLRPAPDESVALEQRRVVHWDVQVVERPAAPVIVPEQSAPVASPAPLRRKRSVARVEAPPPAGTASGSSEAGTAAGAERQVEPDAPVLKSLVPGGDFIARLEGPGSSGTRPGRTVQNTADPDGSQRRARREGEAREAGVRIEGWARDDLAELRVRNGAVDDYFRELGRELERLAQVNRPLDLEVKEGLRRALDGYRMDLQQYGATGAPHLPAASGDQANHTQVPDPQGMHEATARGAVQYERTQELVRRFGAGELVVIAELVQDAQGRVVELAVVRSSGDPLFDAHIEQVALGMGAHHGMPDHVAARSPHGVRTTWEFRGRYNFRKKLRQMDVNSPADAAYLAGMGLGSLFMGGAFDEVTGDIYIVDIRDPKFEVRSRLLRLY